MFRRGDPAASNGNQPEKLFSFIAYAFSSLKAIVWTLLTLVGPPSLVIMTSQTYKRQVHTSVQSRDVGGLLSHVPESCRGLITSSPAQAISLLGKPVFLWDKGWAFLSMAVWANDSLPTNRHQKKSLLTYFLTSPESPSSWKGSGKISLTNRAFFFFFNQQTRPILISPVLATYLLICWMNMGCLLLVSPSWDHFHRLSSLPHSSTGRPAGDIWRLLSITSGLLPPPQWQCLEKRLGLLVSEHTTSLEGGAGVW